MRGERLRARFFAVLGVGAATGLTLVACGGDTEGDASGGTGGAGTGGTSSGGTGTGGTGGVGPGGSGGTAGSNCTTSSIGTCCTSEVCFAPEELPLGTGGMAGTGATDAAPGDADATDAGEAGSDAAFVCPASLPPGGFCTFYSGPPIEKDGKCCYSMTTGSCCGRPFIVDGAALRAGAVTRADWASGDLLETSDLDPTTREALAAAWLDDALFEHASIASFARFTFDLLAFGASPELVAMAQRAAADEVEHATSCFELASGFAGRHVGPGPLAVDARVGPSTLAAAAVAAFREGCVGETLAALQAEAQIEGAIDARVRAALRKIAEDEARHAELAWRFVRWAITEGGQSVRLLVARELERVVQEVEARPAAQLRDGVDLDAWRAHGRLTPAEERRCHLDALRDVVVPCARALVDGAARLTKRARPQANGLST